MTDPGFGSRCTRCAQLVAVRRDGELCAHARPGSTTPCSPEAVGYVIAERHVSGPDKGRLDADWDGLIHEDRAQAEAELANANRCLDEDDPTQTPSDHWKLYELREVL